MSGIEWFRSWHGAPTDSKWLVVARRGAVNPGVVSAVFWALLDHASQQPERGSVAGFDPETYSAWSGFEEEHITAVIRELEAKGVIVDGRLAEWDKRQPRRERESQPPSASTVADRVRKHRANKRRVEPPPTIADPVTPVTTSNDPERPPDKERDTDKKETGDSASQDDAAPPSLDLAPTLPAVKTFRQQVDEEFDSVFWPAYPLKKDRKPARVAFFKARAKADLRDIMAGLALYIAETPQDRDWRYAATFLNKETWANVNEPASVEPTAPSRKREPPHSAMFRALAEMAADSPDDDGRPALSGPRHDDNGGGQGGNSASDDDLEIPPFMRRQ